MKPREFDELVRQKFDQNDFAYDPASWDRLAEQMDGRAKKRNMIMWLWMPAVGMAASVALAIGVTSLFRFGVPGTDGGVQYAHTGKFAPRQERPIAMIPTAAPEAVPQQKPAARKAVRSAAPLKQDKAAVADNNFGIRMQNVTGGQKNTDNNKTVAYNSPAPATKAVLPKPEKKPVQQQVYRTFLNEENSYHKPINLSIALAGGVSQGNRNSGYTAGATVRKMVNDKVYVESDIAFTTSANVQRNTYRVGDATSTIPEGGGSSSASGTYAAKPTSSSDTFAVTNKVTVEAAPPAPGIYKTKDVTYSTYYAQITPGIGYKLIKRMSVGVGADFQQMLVDTRPATTEEAYRGNIQVAPTFDVGFVGKTEYTLTQRVKAAVCYRKGINGVINPSDKYIDRDYLQFQMKCTIFNR